MTNIKASLQQHIDLSRFNDEQIQQLTNSLTDLILTRLSAEIGDHLNDEEIAKLETLTANRNEDELLTWLNQTVPHMSEIISEITDEEVKGFANQIQLLSAVSTQEA